MYRELNKYKICHVFDMKNYNIKNYTIPSDCWRFVRKGYRKIDFDLEFQGQNYKITQIITVS